MKWLAKVWGRFCGKPEAPAPIRYNYMECGGE